MYTISDEFRRAIPESALRDEERSATAQAIARLMRSDADTETTEIFEELRVIVPHEYFAYALFRAYDGRVLRLVNINLPADFVDAMMVLGSSPSSCPVLKLWFARRSPVLIDSFQDSLAMTSSSGTPVAFDAQLDSTGTRGIGFYFVGISSGFMPRFPAVLRTLTPYLYAMMSRRFWAPSPPNASRLLTAREIDVINWMYFGKTNEEIATVLGISVYTVKNHVQKILLKLSATNRTQAVMRAVDAGLVRQSETKANPIRLTAL